MDRLALALQSLGTGVAFVLHKSAIRQSIKDQFDVPAEVLQLLGYGLFVGKK